MSFFNLSTTAMEKNKLVEFFSLEQEFNPNINLYQKLVKNIINNENIPIKELRIIFVDKKYLRNLHKQYLNNSAETDVMTFNLGDKDTVEAEIYISPKKAQENAKFFSVSFQEELARLIIHGLLHLRGFEDRTPREKNQIRELENIYLKNYWISLLKNS